MAGNRNCSVANFSVESLLVLIHRASCEAAIGFLLDFSTASVDPPQLADTGAPVPHCGRSEARHFPEVLPAVPCRKTGPHAAAGQEAYLPLASPWYHWSVKSVSTEAAPEVTRSPQYFATCLPWSLARSTVTDC